MPFKSQAQRRFMFSQHPEIAKKWQAETPDVKLPEVAMPPKKKKKSALDSLNSYLTQQQGKKNETY